MSDFSGFGNFGPSVDLVQIDEDVLAQLRLWLPTYLSQQERDREIEVGFLKRPGDASYVNVLEEGDTLPNRLLPAIVAVTANTMTPPERDGNGEYRGAFRVVTYAFVRGPNDTDTRLQAAMFAAAIRRTLLQKGDEGNLVAGVVWDREGITPVEDASDQSRNLAVGVVEFTVFVDGLANDLAGPSQPEPQPDPDEPYEDLPLVTSVDTEIIAIPINQEGDGP